MKKRTQDIYTVQCIDCKTVIAEIAWTRSQVRAHLKAQGWDVAIPYWAIVPAVIARETKRACPRKTVDICAACNQERIRKAMRAYEEYIEKESRKRSAA